MSNGNLSNIDDINKFYLAGIGDTYGVDSNPFSLTPNQVDSNAIQGIRDQLKQTNTNLGGQSSLLGNIGTGISAITSLGNLYAGLEGLKTQKDALDFNKRLTQANLANQTSSIERELMDRELRREQERGTPSDQRQANAQAYLDRYKLKGTL